MDIAGKIKELAESKLADPAHFVVDVRYNDRQRPAKLLVIIDGDKGVTIDVCAGLSRELAKLLDERDLIPDAYMLEVSTPGLDHPLKLKRQYIKNVGRGFKVHLLNKQIVQGRLESADDNGIVIEEQMKNATKAAATKMTEITYENIERAFVMVSFK